MTITSNRLLDGFIAGLFVAFALTIKDLILYQTVNGLLTLYVSASISLVVMIVLPFIRTRPPRYRRIIRNEWHNETNT
ncbi:hypothetical protein ACI2JA_12800 [Alkalihalobacillus sp. NPDC078783]